MSYVLTSTIESISKLFWFVTNFIVQVFHKAHTTLLASNKVQQLTISSETTVDKNSTNGQTEVRNGQGRGIGSEPTKLQSYIKIPGPFAIPFYGTTLTTPSCKNDFQKSNEYLLQNYGSMVKLEYFWNCPMINLFDAEDIEHIIKIGCPYRPAVKILAMYRTSMKDRYGVLGVAHSNGQEWVSLRSFLDPQLNNSIYNRRLFSTCINISQEFVELLESYGNKRIEAFDQYLFRYNIECACALILGKRLNVLHPESTHKMNVFIAACDPYFNSLAESFTGFPWFTYFSDKVWKKFVENEETIYNTFSEVVEELQSSGELAGLLQHFFEAESNVSYVDRRTIAMDLVLGALEPVHNTVIFTLYLISKHPEVEKEILRELRTILPRTDSTLDESSIDKLSYLKACIQESYRFMPTASRLSRFVDTEVNLRGYKIPPYTLFMCQSWHASMQDSNFYRAKEFLPERWLIVEKDGKRAPPFTPHTPRLITNFGAGKRDCPGRRFMQVEHISLLAKLYRNFKLEFPDDLRTTYKYLNTPVFPIAVKLVPCPD